MTTSGIIAWSIAAFILGTIVVAQAAKRISRMRLRNTERRATERRSGDRRHSDRRRMARISAESKENERRADERRHGSDRRDHDDSWKTEYKELRRQFEDRALSHDDDRATMG